MRRFAPPLSYVSANAIPLKREPTGAENYELPYTSVSGLKAAHANQK